MKKKAVFTEYLSMLGKQRRCADCIDSYVGIRGRMATLWRFTANKQGGINRSSRRPVCEAHAK
jgi:hypothetical protein